MQGHLTPRTLKASQMTDYLSTLLPNVFHQGAKQLGFDDFHAA